MCIQYDILQPLSYEQLTHQNPHDNFFLKIDDMSQGDHGQQ